MGTKALMKAAGSTKGMPKLGSKGMELDQVEKLFNPKNGGKKNLKKSFAQGKGKKKIKPIKGYHQTVDVESDHPSRWYEKTSKRK